MKLAVFLFLFAGLSRADVLIVADEIPAMQVLAAKLEAAESIHSAIVRQEGMPADLSKYSAVIVYIHRALHEPPEKAFVAYAEAGGRLVLLHHSISSGKRSNRYWFPFLKVRLLKGKMSAGGYKWIEGVTLQIVNLAPEAYITSHNVHYDERIPYKEGKQLPGFTLEDSEVYLNHVLQGPRTILLGLKYTDAKSGKTYLQDHAGWFMKTGKGSVVYLMPGHSIRDFENPACAQIVVNAAVYKP